MKEGLEIFEGILGYADSVCSGFASKCRGGHPGANAPIVAFVSFCCGAHLPLCAVVVQSAVGSLAKKAWFGEASVFAIAHANAVSRAAPRSYELR